MTRNEQHVGGFKVRRGVRLLADPPDVSGAAAAECVELVASADPHPLDRSAAGVKEHPGCLEELVGALRRAHVPHPTTFRTPSDHGDAASGERPRWSFNGPSST